MGWKGVSGYLIRPILSSLQHRANYYLNWLSWLIVFLGTMASPVSAALQFLRDRFPGRVITPDADTSAPALASAADFMTLTNQPWFSTCWQVPAAYILPESTSEVATALSIIKQSGIKFVVRSTGHNPNPGFSSIGAEGVLIDLARFQSREIVLHCAGRDKGSLSERAGGTTSNVKKLSGFHTDRKGGSQTVESGDLRSELPVWS
jgi:hypothetical protein